MATSLGWRDVGSVLLSKADAERGRGERLRADGSREEPDWQGEVTSRRVHREARVDKDLERDKEQAATFVTDLNKVIEKRPEGRLKWLHKALLIIGKKQLKPATIYEVINHKRFLIDVTSTVGWQMKALLLANGHLFSPKQQKFLEKESAFSDFSQPKPGAKKEKKEKKEKNKKRKRSSSSSSSRGGRGDRKQASSRGRSGSRKKASSRGRSGSRKKASSRGRSGSRKKASSPGRSGDRKKASSRGRSGSRKKAFSRGRSGSRKKAASRGRSGSRKKAASRGRFPAPEKDGGSARERKRGDGGERARSRSRSRGSSGS